MTPEQRAQACHERFRQGFDEALGGLYRELLPIALRAVRMYLSRFSWRPLSREPAEYAHDAVTTLIEQLILDRQYRCENYFLTLSSIISALIRSDSRDDQRERRVVKKLGERASIPPKDREKTVDERARYVVEIAQTEEGKRAIIELAFSSSYRKAVNSIATFAPRRWIYSRAVELRMIYRMIHYGGAIHDGKAGDLYQYRRGHLARSAEAVLPVRDIALGDDREAPRHVESYSAGAEVER